MEPLEVHSTRASHLVDPHLQIWGWEIPTYLFLGGMAAGVMILVATTFIREPGAPRSRAFRWLAFAAPALLGLGMLALLADLERKAHVFRFYLAFRPTSPMSWGAWILLAVYPATLLFGLAGLRDEDVAAASRWPAFGRILASTRAWAGARAPALAWANIGLGVALGAYTGILLGAFGARAPWNEAVLAPLFLASGVSTAAALAMLLPVSPPEHAFARRVDLAAIAAELGLVALFLFGLATGSHDARQAADLFLGGPWTAPFWALVVLFGLHLPLALEVLETARGLRPVAMAPAAVLAGGFALRWILTAAGQG